MQSEGSTPDLAHEEALWNQGIRFVAGLDEAGRGALAGPVVVAAVVLRPGCPINGVNDSKRVSRRLRERLYREVTRGAEAVGVGVASSREIDRLNVWQATCLAARRALSRLPVPVEYALMDGAWEIAGLTIPQRAVVRGDARSVSIASASIIAKVRRDRIMAGLDRANPGYGFHRHVGYGTGEHVARIRLLGPAPGHRLSFAPLAQTELW